ncbi:hypothetical protein B0H13DRAFT_2393833 [Mycena leptocephala]|nr:hypothetical protein B0H13DRAFT_2393833 [Mycena leptocephala]
MRFTNLFAMLAVLRGAVLLLVQIPSVDGMDAFIDVRLHLWPPFQNIAGLSLQTLNIVPGDFSGLNLNSVAIVICIKALTACIGMDRREDAKPITQDVVTFVGATSLA